MTLAELWNDLRWLLTAGVTATRLKEILRELSSRCLPPQMPGRLLMPDGFLVEIVTTQQYLRIDIGDEDSEGKRRTYWIDRDTLEVKLPPEVAAVLEYAEAPLSDYACERPLYVLKQLGRWNPIVPSDHGVIDPNSFGMPEVSYVQTKADDGSN